MNLILISSKTEDILIFKISEKFICYKEFQNSHSSIQIEKSQNLTVNIFISI